MWWWSSLVVLVVTGCATAGSPPATPSALPSPPSPPTAAGSDWTNTTRSPWPTTSLEGRALALTEACGAPDGALARVAAKLANERARGAGAPDPDRVVSLLRAHGEPHVRPRIVTASSRGSDDDEAIRARLEQMKTPRRRCGVAVARQDDASGREGNELFVAVAIDALADLDALPTRARTGEWLELSASLRVEASRAKLVILGPRGLPRTVPTSLERGPNGEVARVRARFALDQPGAFTVQLVGDLASGPEPLLEARVFADVALPVGEEPMATAPGEEAGAGLDDDATALTQMTAALRSSESLPPLRRDPRLDALATAHADRMRRERTVAHDLGDGDLATRFEQANLGAKQVGENVAHARSTTLAHRALHASPSHRMNLLQTEYTHFGVASLRDDAGAVWVCEVFASGLR
jgi:uncharacterized protein YkwD